MVNLIYLADIDSVGIFFLSFFTENESVQFFQKGRKIFID